MKEREEPNAQGLLARAVVSPSPDAARMAQLERNLIRTTWNAPWARRTRALAGLRWVWLPLAVVAPGLFMAWVFGRVEEPWWMAGALGACGLACLWGVWRLGVALRIGANRRAFLAHGAVALGAAWQSEEIDPLLAWLEEHWPGLTPEVFYGPRGTLVRCTYLICQHSGSPLLVAEWERVCWETNVVTLSGSGGDDLGPDEKIAGSTEKRQCGTLVLLARPGLVVPGSAQIGPFRVLGNQNGREATCVDQALDRLDWRDLQQVLERAS